MRAADIKNIFIKKLQDQEFTVDKTGCKMIEIIGASFLADSPAIFGTPSEDYIRKELRWYKTQSPSIWRMEDPPKQWLAVAGRSGAVNSNYGQLIWSQKYHDQYLNAFNELNANPDSRRACMIYTRPNIWLEYNENGKNDFICTNAVTYYIRDNKLTAVVQMRSNDVVFGYKNDYAWQVHVQAMLAQQLSRSKNSQIAVGDMHWQVQNLHVYERHFKLVQA
jgi:thymidylate synthase